MQSYRFKLILGGVSFRVGPLIVSHHSSHLSVDFVGLFELRSHLKADVLMATSCVCLRCRRMWQHSQHLTPWEWGWWGGTTVRFQFLKSWSSHQLFPKNHKKHQPFGETVWPGFVFSWYVHLSLCAHYFTGNTFAFADLPCRKCTAKYLEACALFWSIINSQFICTFLQMKEAAWVVHDRAILSPEDGCALCVCSLMMYSSSDVLRS